MKLMAIYHYIIVVICTSIYIFNKDISFNSIIISLITISYTNGVMLLNNKRVKNISLFITLMAIIIFPDFAYFLPLIIFVFIGNINYYIIIIMIIIIFYSISLSHALYNLSIGILSYISSNLIIKYQELVDKYYNNNQEINYQLHLSKEKQTNLAQQHELDIESNILYERTRIAHDIHDEVGHLLSGSILQIAALQTIVKDDLTKEQLNLLKINLDESMNAIRKSVHNLNNDGINLEENINHIIHKYKFCEVKLFYNLNDKTKRNIKDAMLYIVKEALNNTSKHSNATLIRIKIQSFNGFNQLQIIDNGSNSTINVDGLGLSSMENRVTKNNGNISISSDNGFNITCIFNEGESNENNNN